MHAVARDGDLPVTPVRARLAALLHRFSFGGAARTARRYEAVARAERASMLDLVVAARGTESPERAAKYLAHAVDEARHAVVFARRAAGLRGGAVEARVRAEADTEDLFRTLGALRVLAVVHHGERRGRAQFEAHARAFARSGARRDARLLGAVLRDEARHEAYTGELLAGLAPAGARAAVRRARIWEAWRTFRRLGRAISAPLFALAMGLVYVAFAPLALVLRRDGGTGFRGPDGDGSARVERASGTR